METALSHSASSRVRKTKMKSDSLLGDISKVMDRLNIETKTSLVTENKLKEIPSANNVLYKQSTNIDADDDISLLSNDSMNDTVYRSVASISSLGSDFSMKSFYTFTDKRGNEKKLALKEIINSIESRAKNNLKPLGFLPTFETLPSNSFSWDKKEYRIKKSKLKKLKLSIDTNKTCRLVHDDSNEKSTDTISIANSKSSFNNTVDGGRSSIISKIQSANRPIVNIIGCNHSIELIIAKADERINKMNYAKRTKKVNDELHNIKLYQSIEQKRQRTERYRQIRIIQQRQAAWMRIISIMHYRSRLQILAHEIKNLRELSIQDKSSLIITKAFREWYKNRMKTKYRLRFKKSVSNNKFRLSLTIRILKKRSACRKIAKFLEECSGHQEIKVVLHSFMHRVRKAQQIARDFLSCKRSRILVLSKLWEKWEKIYIKKKLDERLPPKPKKVGGTLNAKDKKAEAQRRAKENEQFDALRLPSKYKIEMEKCDDKWGLVEDRMQRELQRTSDHGNLKVETNLEAIVKYMLPEYKRKAAITKLLTTARKQHKLEQQLFLTHIEDHSSFSQLDAMQLLKGNKSYMEKRINETLHLKAISHSSSRHKITPFGMFKFIPIRDIIEQIKRLHDEQETFVIKLDKGTINNKSKKGK